jgi:hypothetical protein
VRSILVSILSLALSSAAVAQGVTHHSIDLSANGGISNINGVDNKKGHGSFGFAALFNASSHVAIGAEYNREMLGSLTEYNVTGKEHLQDFGGVARFTLVNTHVVAPYVVIGGGFTKDTATVSSGSLSESETENGGYLSAGGGASFFLFHGFGIRPEVRFERHQMKSTTIDGVSVSGGGENDAHATIALFYQFGGRH